MNQKSPPLGIPHSDSAKPDPALGDPSGAAAPVSYPPEVIDEWVARAKGWAAEGRDVFLGFINATKVHAPPRHRRSFSGMPRKRRISWLGSL